MDYINNQIMKQRKAEKRFADLNTAMQQYFIVTGRQLEPLPPKPVLSDFYVPSEDHHNSELTFITLINGWNRSLSVVLRLYDIFLLIGVPQKGSYSMSIYIGNDLEDRLEALEVENMSLRKYNEYWQVVDEIDHTLDLHVDSSFYKRSMKLDNYVKINEWFDSSIGQSSVIQ